MRSSQPSTASGTTTWPRSCGAPRTRTSRFAPVSWTNLSTSSWWLRPDDALDDLAGDQVDQRRDTPVDEQGVLGGFEPEQVLERADEIVTALEDPAHDLVALVGLVQ